MTSELRESALRLSHELGDPAHDWAILAEGNVSAAAPENTMFIKASGVSMVSAELGDYVHVSLTPILRLLDDEGADDETVGSVLMASRIDDTAKRPSVEAILHAVCIDVAGAKFVGHTHPTDVNSLLCSSQAQALVAGGLFPDQIVVLGQYQLLIPYTDPGLSLGRLVRERLRAFTAEHGSMPKVIYLVNHGMFALGHTAEEVSQITLMAAKSARILAGALAIGAPVHLSARDAERIDTRPDELLRRVALGQKGETPWS
ncbi:MAG: class aldolase/adducin family protein [Subtercola sp.]|jgi:rhamnose utilization protein RhaD (predicted bifunctional aldolase and dehydrogenase)|nr:class aldolase/adducin family protein [Subtercola sp.]